MKISALDVRACAHATDVAAGDALTGVARPQTLDYLVVTVRTECGREASMFGFAGASAVGSAHLAKGLEAFLKGRDARDREAIWHAFRRQDRFWGLLPIYIWGPIDCCLWLLAAEAAGQPLWRFIGGYREEVPVYLSSMFHKSGEPYIAEALAAQAAGYGAYKLHPPGNSIDEDLAIHRAVREAVGPDFGLMSDPVAFMTGPEALRYGRALEDLNYVWFEEPVQDEDWRLLKALADALDIAVVAAETLAKHPYSVAPLIAERAVDAVRADVSWTGGITGTLKTARMAEGFGLNCEIHTAIYHPLEMANLHVCAATRNCGWFELLAPVDAFAFGLTEPLPLANGMARLPEGPGLGRALDWDLIDAETLLRL